MQGLRVPLVSCEGVHAVESAGGGVVPAGAEVVLLHVSIEVLARIEVAGCLRVYIAGIRRGDGFVLQQDAVAVIGKVIDNCRASYGSTN